MRKELQTPFNERQYMLSKDFEIFYYNDFHFKTAGRHTHDYFEFYAFIEGKANLFIGKQKYLMQPGDLYIIPPNVPHYSQIFDNNVHYRRFVFWINCRYVDYILQETADFDYIIRRSTKEKKYLYHFDNEKFNTLQNKFLQLLEETHANRYGKEFALKHNVNDIILFINRTVYESENVYAPDDSHSLLQSLSLYIENHLDESLNLNDLAEHFYVSKYYISHLFTETYGISIHQYILKKRLSACKNSLLDGERPSIVSLNYGIHDYSCFYRAFKKEYGLTPKEFQDVYMNDPERKRK